LNPKINKLSFSLLSGQTISLNLPLGGFGVVGINWTSIYMTKQKRGCRIFQEAYLTSTDNNFTVKTNLNTYKTALVLGAFGKIKSRCKTRAKFYSKKIPIGLG
jgi:hypothetical protein